MVFIDERHTYLGSLADKPKQMALFALVSDETFQLLKSDFSETDTIYFLSIQAIKKNSKDEFNAQYSKISKRKISENSTAPFIHDDFLIFTLIIGVLKFECDKEWLAHVVHNRAKSPITNTLENLLAGNYQSKANIQSLVLIFLFLSDKGKITNENLVEAYNALSDTKQSFNNDFIRIINYRAFDIIIQYKLPRDTDQISRLLEFEPRFKKRINAFTYIVYNTFLVLLLFGAYKLLNSLPEEIKSKINEVGIIIGIGGIGLFGNIIPILRNKFKDLTFRAFGYK